MDGFQELDCGLALWRRCNFLPYGQSRYCSKNQKNQKNQNSIISTKTCQTADKTTDLCIAEFSVMLLYIPLACPDWLMHPDVLQQFQRRGVTRDLLYGPSVLREGDVAGMVASDDDEALCFLIYSFIYFNSCRLCGTIVSTLAVAAAPAVCFCNASALLTMKNHRCEDSWLHHALKRTVAPPPLHQQAYREPLIFPPPIIHFVAASLSGWARLVRRESAAAAASSF